MALANITNNILTDSGILVTNLTPTSRTLTINGVTYDLSADRSWTIATGLSGSGTANQLTYWDGTSSVTGSATLTYSPTAQLLVNNSVTAATAIARGVNFTPTLVAAANNDVLVGLDINPTFTNGAFTGVSNIGLRVAGATIIGATNGLRVLGSSFDTNTGGFIYSGGGGGGDLNLSANFEPSGTVTNSGAQSSRIRLTGNTFNASFSIVNGSTSFPAFFDFIPNESRTSGTRYGASWTSYFQPTSGNAFYSSINIRPVINTTGTYSGTVVGILYNPTLTSLTGATHRAIETVTGDVVVGSTSGSLLVGTTTNAGFRLDVNGTGRFSNNLTIGQTSYLAGTYSLDVTTGGIAGIAEVARFAANGNGGTGRGSGIVISAPGSANTVSVARLVGYQETASATANNASFAIQVANSSGTLTEYFKLNNAGNLLLSGQLTANSFVPTSSTIPTNGMYLSGTNTLGLATNGTLDMVINEVGSVGIGTTSLTGFNLRISKSLTGSVSTTGIQSGGVIQSDVTSDAQYFSSSASTAAAAFTITDLAHFIANQGTFGAGSTVTKQYGFRVAGGLTGATNNYAFFSDIAAATGRWNLFMNGTADNHLGGKLTIGSATTSSNSTIYISRAITGSASSNGIIQELNVSSDVTTQAFANRTILGTVAASFTLPILSHYVAGQGTIGAGSTVTSQIGYWAQSNMIGATTNIGFYGDIASGTNRWNIYMNGTANNYLAGNLGIGNTSVDTTMLRISRAFTSTLAASILLDGQISSTGTGQTNYLQTTASTAAASFTAASIRHINIQQGTFGAGSTVTNQFGVFVGANMIGATSNYGFFGDIPSGTNRWNLYMNGTAANYLAGSLGIGSTSLTEYGLRVAKNITGATVSYAIRQDGTVQSDVTSTAYGVSNSLRTANATFTLPIYYHFFANAAALGTNSAVTNQYAYFADASLTGATNNFGFYGNIASGTNRWNLYMNGTANNYMAGKLLVGSTSDNGATFQVTGSATISSTLTTNGSVIVNPTSAANSFIRMSYSGSNFGLIGSRSVVGSGANDFMIYAYGNNSLAFWTNNVERFTIAGTGAATFSSSVTATGGLISNGGSIGYGGGELGFGVTSSGATSAIYTLAVDSPVLYFDHRATGNTGFWVWRNGSGAGSERMRLTASGNLGIGTTSPTANLQVYQAGTAGNNYVEGTIQVGGTSSTLGGAFSYAAQNSGYVNITNLNNGGGANARISFGFGAITSGLPANNVMTINQSGNVGIGTTSPAYKLEVNNSSADNHIAAVGTTPSLQLMSANSGPANWGTIGMATATNNFIVGASAGDLAIVNRGTTAGNVLFGFGSTEKMRLTSDGVLAIGTTSTSTEGNLFLGAKTTSEGGQLVLQKGTSYTYAAHVDNYQDSFRIISGTDTTSSTVRMSINLSTGDVTFNSGLTAGQITSGVLGTGTVYSNAGVLTNTNPSDRRLKTNIIPLTYGLADILKLNPVSYNWKDGTNGKQFGFIAQEVQEVMPDAVKNGEYLGLEKDAIYSALVNAIKEQQAQINELKSQLK